MSLETEFLARLVLKVGTPQPTGVTAKGERRIVAIQGGSFEGPSFKGTVPAMGGDWIWADPDGTTRLDVRVSLTTHDGALIYYQYRGLRHGPAEIMQALAAGEEVDPASYYFRTAGFMETGDSRYDWLNKAVILATGHRLPDGPIYELHVLK